MKLEELFANILREPIDQFSEGSSPKTIGSWDSLRHIELVMAAEVEYGIRFSTAEVATIRTLGCMRGLLTQKGVSV
jgi:acyl carrier protein